MSAVIHISKENFRLILKEIKQRIKERMKIEKVIKHPSRLHRHTL